MANPQSDDLDSEVSYCRTSDFNLLYYTPISEKRLPKHLFLPQYAHYDSLSNSSHTTPSSPNFCPSPTTNEKDHVALSHLASPGTHNTSNLDSGTNKLWAIPWYYYMYLCQYYDPSGSVVHCISQVRLLSKFKKAMTVTFIPVRLGSWQWKETPPIRKLRPWKAN